MNSRDSYNLKKIQKLNSVDQAYNKDNLFDLIIKPQKVEKTDINIQQVANIREKEGEKELQECIKKRTNFPYKGIIKNFDYTKIRENHKEDLVVHKVTEADKINFDTDYQKYNEAIDNQNKELNDKYSNNKKNEHKKEFEYQHKYKYRSKLDNAGTDEQNLRVDRIEYYKKEQLKVEENKKKIDDILIGLIESGVLSEDLDKINYDKIDVNELEDKLKKEFGEEEFKKLMNDLK